MQLRLLDLQAVDSRLDALRTSRDRAPQIAELEQRVGEHRRLTEAVTAAQAEVDRLAQAQAAADREVEAVRAKRDRDQRRLDGGQVASAKELQALQHEVATLTDRQAELEERELEVMEELETAQHAHRALVEEQHGVADRGRAARSGRDEAWARIDAETAGAQAERDQVAAEVPTDLRTRYERLRAQHGGVGAAALERGSCGGCRMQLPPTELGRLRAAPPDEVLTCTECGRILVRTDPS